MTQFFAWVPHLYMFQGWYQKKIQKKSEGRYPRGGGNRPPPNLSRVNRTTFTKTLCLQTWQENPVITSVAQIPIESIVFPPVTICPLFTLEENNEEPSAAWDAEDLVLSCNFTKNNWNTGDVCDRIQVMNPYKGFISH